MADFFDAYNEVASALTDISSLLTAALCVREHQQDLNVISDLLYLTEKKMEEAQGLVKMMNQIHRKAVGKPRVETES
jgi:hypothetical protein